jgi:hypothetical protein
MRSSRKHISNSPPFICFSFAIISKESTFVGPAFGDQVAEMFCRQTGPLFDQSVVVASNSCHGFGATKPIELFGCVARLIAAQTSIERHDFFRLATCWLSHRQRCA